MLFPLAFIRSHLKAIAVIPVLLGIGLMILTGRTFLFKSGAVWALVVIATSVAAEGFHSARSKLPRHKRAALVDFLQFGGYSLAVGAMAVLIAVMFWNSHQLRWATWLMFAGILMWLSSGIVYRPRRRKAVIKQKDTTVV